VKKNHLQQSHNIILVRSQARGKIYFDTVGLDQDNDNVRSQSATLQNVENEAEAQAFNSSMIVSIPNSE
jgi:hypothetical protein